jgi:LuxR family transcriptional regulator, quorum-sensing system regulator SdiA
MKEFAERKAGIARILVELHTICDRGFALAIHIRYTRPTLLYQTYDQSWADTYSERGYMLSDPVVRWGLNNTGWVEWASLADQDPEGVLADAVAHGLTNGWTYATGPAASRTIAGLPCSSAGFTPDERAALAVTIDQLHELTDGFETLSPTQQDALRALP